MPRILKTLLIFIHKLTRSLVHPSGAVGKANVQKTLFFVTALFPPCAAAGITVTDATVFATQHAGEPSAVFLALTNDTNRPVSLAVAQSPQAARLELHGMQNGRMLTVSGIEIPAKGGVRLKRGGLHIMVFETEQALRAGDKFPLVLGFDDGEWVDVEAAVVAR